ncbi:glycosyltransferase, partial [Turicibacter sanguinis]|nr:glycosyltransferase [Turicibacter sanguinis]
MNDFGLISVIVPVYNVQLYLKRCIDSILNQTYKNLEIILINDGSTDESGKICEEYLKLDNRIKVYHTNNKGVSVARNIGLMNISGKYLTFVDSDDYLDPHMYEKMITKMVENECDICVCNFYFSYDKKLIKNNIKKNIPDILCREQFLKYTLESGFYYGFLWNKLYDVRNIFNSEIRKFDINIHILEDLLYNCQIIENINKVYFLNEELYYYYQNEKSVLHSSFSMKSLSTLEALIKIIDIATKYEASYVNILKIKFVIDL